MANTPREIERMVRKIRQQTPGEIHVCYEAGVCGFVLQRQFQKLGCVAKVIAPSLVLRKPGERVKAENAGGPGAEPLGIISVPPSGGLRPETA